MPDRLVQDMEQLEHVAAAMQQARENPPKEPEQYGLKYPNMLSIIFHTYIDRAQSRCHCRVLVILTLTKC